MRYVIDVTQLVHWEGNLTGIPRVMDELARRFLTEYREESVFVSWVKEIGQMCEIDFHLREASAKNTESIKYVADAGKTEKKVEIRGELVDFAKKAVKLAAKKTRFDRTGVYKKMQHKAAFRAAQGYKVYAPKTGDKFFIPWGEWWDRNYLELLKEYAAGGTELFPLCHDIFPMVIPQFSGNSSSLADFVREVFPVAQTVLTISKSTENDLRKWMEGEGLAVPKIARFRLGEDFAVGKRLSDKEMQEKFDLPKEFLISVGTLEARKNHTLVYYVYKLARQREIELPKIYLIGREGHRTENVVDFIKEDPEINQKIKIINMNGDELAWFYKNCLFAVQPSFYEGWGLPIIETIASGNPVVCSNTSSMTEIAEEQVLHFSPYSTDECLSAIGKMLEPKTLADFREKCKKYKMHSWDAAFQQVVNILKEEK